MYLLYYKLYDVLSKKIEISALFFLDNVEALMFKSMCNLSSFKVEYNMQIYFSSCLVSLLMLIFCTQKH